MIQEVQEVNVQDYKILLRNKFLLLIFNPMILYVSDQFWSVMKEREHVVKLLSS
jgi:hypothetical protein